MARKFDKKGDKGDSGDDGGELIVVPEAWTEPRCHVCTSQYRKAIDRMIAMGTAHAEIARIFGGIIDRRSIANHAKKHLAYEEAAMRQIIEQEAKAAEEDAELGINGILKRRVYLETMLHKGLEDLVSGHAMIEPRDVLAVIDALNKFDNQNAGAALDQVKIQFQAFLQAIREVAAARGDPSLGSDILIRARQIAGEDAPQIGP